MFFLVSLLESTEKNLLVSQHTAAMMVIVSWHWCCSNSLLLWVCLTRMHDEYLSWFALVTC